MIDSVVNDLFRLFMWFTACFGVEVVAILAPRVGWIELLSVGLAGLFGWWFVVL